MLVKKPATLPILYSFRRCPYAMRARMGLYRSGLLVELREVKLAEMPQQLRALVADDPTVPVLRLPDGEVIAQSWDIVLWALRRNDPDRWLGNGSSDLQRAGQWIEINDFSFKPDLDRYKYAERFPEYPATHYRRAGEAFLRDLERQLDAAPYLLGRHLSVADIGIFPFIRQFAHVDRDWFAAAPYPRLQQWLNNLLDDPLFIAIMAKYPAWRPGQEPVLFGAAQDD